VDRVIIETRKREREKRIESNAYDDDDDNVDGDQEENEEKHKQRRIKKKGVLFFINGESAARHDTLEERRNSCSLYPSIAFVYMYVRL
jgi:hypothetical protein